MISQANKIDIDYIADLFSQRSSSDSRTPLSELRSGLVGEEYVPAKSDHEMRVAQIWQDVLGIEQIGVHDNFHDIGGDSLIAIKIVSRIEELFPADFNIELLFQYPTILELAAYLESQDSAPNAGEATELEEGTL